MGPRGRILYLVELDAAEAAVTWQVAQFSKAWHAPVVLLAVRKPRWLAFVGREEQRAVKRELLGVAKRLRELKAHVAGIRVTAGHPATVTPRLAVTLGAELIMVSAGAGVGARNDTGSGTGREQIASSAHAVATHARQDVWVCRPDADPHLEHVLCAADTSPLAALAIQRAVDICRRFNARLRVVSVLAEPEATDTSAGADPENASRTAHRAQKLFLDQFDLRGVPLSRAIVWGATPVELLLEAEHYGDGLLVMGATSGARGPGLGATAEPMVRACPSSVLIVRRRSPAPGLPPETEAGTEVAVTDPADGG